MALELGRYTTQGRLRELLLDALEHGGHVYVGSTEDPRARRAEHAGRFAGFMLVARTDNMMHAEDRLLGIVRDYPRGRRRQVRNEHMQSGAAEEGGYVYAIFIAH